MVDSQKSNVVPHLFYNGRFTSFHILVFVLKVLHTGEYFSKIYNGMVGTSF